MLANVLIGICIVGVLAFGTEALWIVGEQEGWWG